MQRMITMQLAAAFAGLVFAVSTAQALPITHGNIVIYRAGDGVAAPTTAAAAVTMQEYTPAGVLVQTITVPSTGSTALTTVGNSTTEGVVTLTENGSKFVFGGYRKAAGGTQPSSDTATVTNRVVGTLDLAGNVDTSVAISSGVTSNLRGVATRDGSTYYVTTASIVGYLGTPGPASTVVSVDARNSRQVSLASNVVFASNGSTTITPKVQSYGVAPTGTTTPATIVNLALTDAVHGFYLADLDPSVGFDGNGSSIDTIYAMSSVENLMRKYSFVSGSWVSNGSIPGNGAQALGGQVNGSVVSLYSTTTTQLRAYTDNSGYNGALAGTSSAIATVASNFIFRGLAVAVPETSAFAFAGLACCASGALAVNRRRRAAK